MARTKPYQVLGADVIGKLMECSCERYLREMERNRRPKYPSPIIETAPHFVFRSASLRLSMSSDRSRPVARTGSAIVDESRSLAGGMSAGSFRNPAKSDSASLQAGVANTFTPDD